ncbi:2-hydroxychromene-2-carboxylate isomerase [Halobacteriovorax sp. HLS]|uniref:2-hydroxychromene-2-carboxylate isomerase n=1 Tax=Halobacteriovorax sp. HLS TaxID=2234000 RepID=UPI000FDCB23E|nr:2-hydroxychromene-2-carboxylate isomerase [Halobacteriovorax sp. HLS]
MDFYFDFLSPYSYLAFQWLKKNKVLLDGLSIELNFVPVTMAKIIHSHETKGPAEIETKRNYLFRDCLRYSAVNKIDFVAPKSLPFNSLYALRLVLAVNEPGDRFKMIDSLFSASWGSGKDISDEFELKSILEEAGFSTDLLEMTTSKDIRRILKTNVNGAIDRGVFGVPTFFYKDELFWGNDSTKYLELAIAGKDPMDKDKYNNFLNNHPFN